MKKLVEVTTIQEFEIEIPDELLTDEYLEEFSSFMWKVDSLDDLFKYVATSATSGITNVDGLGRVSPSRRGSEKIYPYEEVQAKLAKVPNDHEVYLPSSRKGVRHYVEVFESNNHYKPYIKMEVTKETKLQLFIDGAREQEDKYRKHAEHLERELTNLRKKNEAPKNTN